MPDKLKILYVCSEVAPLIKTGGLADVSNALPRALHAQGHDVRVALPCYRAIPVDARGEIRGTCYVTLDTTTEFGAFRESRLPNSEIPLYLIEHEGYFDRDHPYGAYNGGYADNLERFCFFCMAVLDVIPQTGWRPDIVHCHDWHTSPIPSYLKTRLHREPFWMHMPTVFTIHNLAYQGRFPKEYLAQTGLGLDLFHPGCIEFYDDINLMKGAICFANRLSTVSPRYAKEIQTPAFGYGLDGFLRTRSSDITGILNGIDRNIWNPETDPHIAANYSAHARDGMEGKSGCKRALQSLCGFPENDAPLFGMVSRLVWEKGIDILLNAMEQFVAKGAQLVVLGTGETEYEAALAAWAEMHPDTIHVFSEYNEALAHQVYAGADFCLMPSRIEPCGLSQMYALAYGTVPIVRETGGLADSVRDLTSQFDSDENATGLLFRPTTGRALANALTRALSLYAIPSKMRQMRLAGMRQDLSWDRSSREYVELFRKAMGVA